MNNEQGGLRTVVCCFDAVASQSVAWFEDAPQTTFSSDMPVNAARRLLSNKEAPEDEYFFRIFLSDTFSHTFHFRWEKPDLLFRCEACHGKGGTDGFTEKYKCKRCHGTGSLKG